MFIIFTYVTAISLALPIVSNFIEFYVLSITNVKFILRYEEKQTKRMFDQ